MWGNWAVNSAGVSALQEVQYWAGIGVLINVPPDFGEDLIPMRKSAQTVLARAAGFCRLFLVLQGQVWAPGLGVK